MSSFQQKFTKHAYISLPKAAMRNHYNLSGLKQQKCISLLSWKPEIHNHYHRAEIKVSAGWPPLEGSGGESLPSIFQLLAVKPPFLDLWLSHSVLSVVTPSPLLWDSWVDEMAYILGNLPISKARKKIQTAETKQTWETDSDMTPMLEWSDRTFKITATIMLKILMEKPSPGFHMLGPKKILNKF